MHNHLGYVILNNPLTSEQIKEINEHKINFKAYSPYVIILCDPYGYLNGHYQALVAVTKYLYPELQNSEINEDILVEHNAIVIINNLHLYELDKSKFIAVQLPESIKNISIEQINCFYEFYKTWVTCSGITHVGEWPLEIRDAANYHLSGNLSPIERTIKNVELYLYYITCVGRYLEETKQINDEDNKVYSKF